MDEDEILDEAAALIKAGERGQAGQLLMQLLRANPQSADGWYLFSFTLPDRSKQVEALDRALRADPFHRRATARKAKLTGGEPSSSPRRETAHTPAATAWAEPTAPDEPKARRTRSEAPREPEKQTETDAPAGLPGWVLPAAGGIVTLLCVGIVVAGLAVQLAGARQPTPAAWSASAGPSPTSAVNAGLPPTYTVTPTPGPTNTPTPTPFLPPNEDVSAQMRDIQLEVADVRGLEIRGEVPAWVVDPVGAGVVISEIFDENFEGRAYLDDQAHSQVLLGFLTTTYDLYNASVSHLTDGLGGFYLPWEKQIYVLGEEFTGLERFIYSHEYGHALVDQHFDINGMGVYPTCQHDQQHCKAIRALVEGDATLVMYQWLEQHGRPKDYEDIYDSGFEDFGDYPLPDQFPPPYLGPDGAFPYDFGFEFVSYIYERNNGRWAAVNEVYRRLPTTTEQIIHPEKYLAGEQAIAVTLPDSLGVLGEGWRLLEEDVLGEWDTFLLLSYAADVQAQRRNSDGIRASTGWGGDRYRTYFNDATGAGALTAQWVWDTDVDADEFYTVIKAYMFERFRGGVVESSRGECWAATGQTTCLYRNGREVLWVIAPTMAQVEAMVGQFGGFQ